MRRKLILSLLLCLALAALLGVVASAEAAPLQFNVSFAPNVHAMPLDGRLLVFVSTTNDPEPRLQADAGWVTDSPPFWGMDVDDMQPGTPVVFGGAAVYGFPLASFDQLPAGDYYVQALLNVYTTFHRADGSVVKLHLPGGDGQDPFISPGNLVSTPTLLHLDPAVGGSYDLALDQELPPLEPVPAGGTTQQGNPPDSKHVKHIKIKSDRLSTFWGQPMYLGANVLLPRGYSDPKNRKVRYPVLWIQDHFVTADLTDLLGGDFSRWWMSKSAPRFIIVMIRQENPFYDDSYAVNSANLGPYGDAITKELIPAVDRSFRIISARWARTTGGFSTGGYEAAAQMIFYPRLYSGAWVFCPDPVDFHRLELVNIYEDSNAFFLEYPWLTVPRPAYREASGEVAYTMEQENHRELALGTHGRSGQCTWDIYQAAFGPQGADGYPAPIWDKQTGVIDPVVAQQWKSKDLDDYLRSHWATVGPKVAGRMFFFCGSADNYFYNNALQLFQENTKKLSKPKADFTFRWGLNGEHGWMPMTFPQLFTSVARYMARHAPDGTDVSGWINM